MFLSFCVLDDFFLFSKKLGFGVFLVHPPMASALLSASVERCFVSCMQDFLMIFCLFLIVESLVTHVSVAQRKSSILKKTKKKHFLKLLS